MDKEVRPCNRCSEQIRHRTRQRSRRGGEQGRRTLLPEPGQPGSGGQDQLQRRNLGAARKSYKGSRCSLAPALLLSLFSEVRGRVILRSSDAIRVTLPNPQTVHSHPNSRAATINTMPIVATFHTSDRISG